MALSFGSGSADSLWRAGMGNGRGSPLGNSPLDKAIARHEQHLLRTYCRSAMAVGRKVAHQMGEENPSDLDALHLGFENWGATPGEDAIEWVRERTRALEELRKPKEVATVEPELPAQAPLVQRLRRKRGEEKLTKEVKFRAGPEQLARWQERADQEGVDLSTLMRRSTDEVLALHDAMERHPGQREREE
jgi:hypothetical protein